MDYDYLEMSIPFHHLLHQVYLKISMMTHSSWCINYLLGEVLSSIPINFDEDIKKRPQVTNEVAWLENIPTGSSSQKILQRAAVIKIQVKICPLSQKRNKNPGQDLPLLPKNKIKIQVRV